jgi:hypothetical protein
VNSLVLHGVITADGRLEMQVPEGLPPGPVEVELRLPDLPLLTSEDLLASELVGLWADRDDIGDSVTFAESLRKRASRRGEG